MKNQIKINLNNIRSNILNIKKQTNKKIISVVKADAYSHGANKVSKFIENDVDVFAVANLCEALRLIKSGIKKDILILGISEKSTKYENIIYSISTMEDAIKLKGKRVHIKVNSGMNRYGTTDKYFYQKVKKIVKVEGVYSHFYNAKNMNNRKKQLEEFENITSLYNKKLLYHIDSSFSTISNYYLKENQEIYNKKFDAVRIGIVQFLAIEKGFLNAKSIFSYVKDTRFVKKGKHIGYGENVAKKDCFVSIIPMGYADGIDRRMSEKAFVLINNNKYFLIGNVCMDCFFVLTDISVKKNDNCIILNDEINLELLSNLTGIYKYELLLNFRSNRINFLYN